MTIALHNPENLVAGPQPPTNLDYPAPARRLWLSTAGILAEHKAEASRDWFIFYCACHWSLVQFRRDGGMRCYLDRKLCEMERDFCEDDDAPRGKLALALEKRLRKNRLKLLKEDSRIPQAG